MKIVKSIGNLYINTPIKSGIFSALAITAPVIFGTFALANAFERGPLHQSTNTPISEQVDKFVKSDYNKPDINELDCYRVDTFKITPEEFNNYAILANSLQDRAARHVDKVVVRSKMTPAVTVGTGSKGGIGIGFAVHHDKEPLYYPSSVKTIMQNKVFVNKDGDQFYVPVECYGEKNKNLPPKYFRDKKN